ncbi:hypothetical protein [Achromobacter mucicolens]|uniref:hypothetical protein n=1 Tax=Achromobacter mucicolens TaxID=1389922 RepID=UPI001CBB1F7E|nr:hypothetical protein [Achromobacter mucicolens]UAN03043.1 hypothetical protein K9D24_02350 [Achromobacter mucicolens]
METKAQIEALNTAVAQLDAFKSGVLLALLALKAGIQASPNFNQQALEDSLDFFLATPPKTDFPDDALLPIRTLKNDMTKLLQEVRHLD